MTPGSLLVPIFIPSIAAVLVLLLRRCPKCSAMTFLIASALNAAAVFSLYGREMYYSIPWGGFGFTLSFRLYHFSFFIIAAAAALGFLNAIFTWKFMKEKKYAPVFLASFLVTLGFANGAVLSDSLIAFLFFWEGLLIAMFAMIAVGHRGAFKTAVKALIISGTADLCLMLGIGIIIYVTGSMTISEIHLPVDSKLPGIAFALVMIGAIAKGGSMPFHSWIPDAAKDSPVPFMAFVPSALEKLLGIYFLTRISLDMFILDPNSWASYTMMTIGAVTIILAVLMALIQKDFKKLLSFHAISQMGYMVLGIGTAVPAGIIGGIFHMINNALYKCCLFLTGGAVERQTGTTDLNRLGSLARAMPVTFIGFFIAAVSISGVPPFNGFFSKELVYDGALERGLPFYLAALIGTFLTAASFLKLGHAAFLDKRNPENARVREAPLSMLIPIAVIAIACVALGLFHGAAVKAWFMPILADTRLAETASTGFHMSAVLVTLSIVVLIAAILHHIWGARRSGAGITAVDHIHHAPIAGAIYDKAERGRFDPYNIGMWLAGLAARLAWTIDRAIDFIYDGISVSAAFFLSRAMRRTQTGSHAAYVAWSIIGLILVLMFMTGGSCICR